MSENTGRSMPPSVPPSVPPPARTSSTTLNKPPTRISATAQGTGSQGTGSQEFEAGRQPQQPIGYQLPASNAEVGGTAGASVPPSSQPKPKVPGPRRVRLAVSRIDPWSMMKLSFLLSIAVGIGIVVATATVWTVLNQMGVFASINAIIDDIGARNQFGTVLKFLEFSQVLSVATVIAVVNIVLMTALATLGAFIYNLVAAMVGGLHLTLTDD